MNPIQKFNYLLQALKSGQEDFTNDNLKMLGFLIGALAWLLINDKTRDFLKKSRMVRWLVVLTLVAGYISHILYAQKLMALSQEIKLEILDISGRNFEILNAYYEYYIITSAEFYGHIMTTAVLIFAISGIIFALGRGVPKN